MRGLRRDLDDTAVDVSGCRGRNRRALEVKIAALDEHVSTAISVYNQRGIGHRDIAERVEARGVQAGIDPDLPRRLPARDIAPPARRPERSARDVDRAADERQRLVRLDSKRSTDANVSDRR